MALAAAKGVTEGLLPHTDDNTDADVVGLFRAKGKLACRNALIVGRLKKRTTTQDTTLQVGVGRPLRALGVNLRI